MANKDIRRINETEASIKTNLTNGKSAVESDGEHAHIHKTGDNLYYPANSKIWTGAANTYCDASFATVALGQGQLSLISDTGTGIIYESARNGRADGTHYWKQNTSDIAQLSAAKYNVEAGQINLKATDSSVVLQHGSTSGLTVHGASGDVGDNTTVNSGTLFTKFFQAGPNQARLIAGTTLEVEGTAYVQQSGGDVALYANATGAGSIAAFSKNGVAALEVLNSGTVIIPGTVALDSNGYYSLKYSSGDFGILMKTTENPSYITMDGYSAFLVNINGVQKLGINVSTTTLSNALIFGAHADIGDGSTIGSPLSVSVANKSWVNLTPTSNSYYTLAGGSTGQLIVIYNTSATYNPYIIGSTMSPNIQMGTNGAGIFVYTAGSTFRPINGFT